MASGESPALPSVLVTGAAGYLGRIVVHALHNCRERLGGLVGLDVRPVPAAERLDGVAYVTADIAAADLAALMREHAVDTVLHLASLVRVPKGAPSDLAWRVDVLGTKNVIGACLATGARKLIVTSSGAAYGYHADNAKWLDEDDPLRGNDDFPYSRHKHVVEEMLAEARRDHPELGQLVFRPGTILGADVHSPVTDLFEKPLMLGVWGATSPFVFIWDHDVVACILEGVLTDKVGIYNLAGDGALTPREIAHRLGKLYVPIPAVVLRLALRLARRLGLSERGPEHVKFLQYRPVLSNRRLKEQFGYAPQLSSAASFDLYARERHRHA